MTKFEDRFNWLPWNFGRLKDLFKIYQTDAGYENLYLAHGLESIISMQDAEKIVELGTRLKLENTDPIFSEMSGADDLGKRGVVLAAIHLKKYPDRDLEQEKLDAEDMKFFERLRPEWE